MKLVKAAERAQWKAIRKLYEGAFPACEKKPFWLIRLKNKQGRADVWYLEEDGQFIGLGITMSGPGLVLLDYFAIGQATPGIIAVNVATFLGYSRAGILGAIIATLGVVTPSIIIISIIAKFLSGFSENITVKKALAGINVVVAALLTKVLWGFRKKIFSSILAFILFLLAFLGIAFFNVNTILIVVASIFIGLGFFFLNNNSSNSSTGKE